MPSRDRKRCQWFYGRGLCCTIAIVGAFIPLLSLSYLVLASGSTSPQDTLLMTSVLFRHGDRAPSDFYPTDPYKDPSYWPEGLGALTNKGKMEAYNLGKWLRLRYNNFVPEMYHPDDTYVVSSNHDRCLMSAQSLLAGFYPPKGSQIWNPDLIWQPIPVHTTPRELDKLIVVGKSCPRYSNELNRIREENSKNADYQETFKHLTKHSGKNVKNLLGAEGIFNTLEIEVKRGHDLPDWTKSLYPEPLKTMSSKCLAEFTANDLLKRLKGGPLVKEIITSMVNKSAEQLKPNRKLFLYSGHDLTIVSLLATLGIPGLFKPDPASAVLLELHRHAVTSSHVVEVYYLSDIYSQKLQPVDIPSCPRPCQLGQLVASVKQVLPDNWDEECEQS